MLERITPVILTLNEAPNLPRLLAALDWAKEIIVLDSFSQDETAQIAKAHPKVRFFERAFDNHAAQWQHALQSCDIKGEWVLRLDADYLPTPELTAELGKLDPPQDIAAYSIGFRYCIDGKPLRASLYPANCVLFRKGSATPWQDGHTERWRIDGKTAKLKGRLLHDDRKSVKTWLAAQLRYLPQERDKLQSPGAKLDFADRLRLRLWLMPLLTFLHLLIFRGLILDGRAGLTYAYQRLLAETALALFLLEARDKEAGK